MIRKPGDQPLWDRAISALFQPRESVTERISRELLDRVKPSVQFCTWVPTRGLLAFVQVVLGGDSESGEVTALPSAALGIGALPLPLAKGSGRGPSTSQGR